MHYLIFAILFSIFPNILAFGHGEPQFPEPTTDCYQMGTGMIIEGCTEEGFPSPGNDVDDSANPALPYRLDQLMITSTHWDLYFEERLKSIKSQIDAFYNMNQFYGSIFGIGGGYKKKGGGDVTIIKKRKEDEAEENQFEYTLARLVEESDKKDGYMESELCDIIGWLEPVLNQIDAKYFEPGVSFDRQNCEPNDFIGTDGVCLDDQLTTEGKLICIEERSRHRDLHIGEHLAYLEEIWPTVKKYIVEYNIFVFPDFRDIYGDWDQDRYPLEGPKSYPEEGGEWPDDGSSQEQQPYPGELPAQPERPFGG